MSGREPAVRTSMSAIGVARSQRHPFGRLSMTRRALPMERSIAPTALHLLDIAIPPQMEAPVMTSVLDEGYVRTHPVRIAEDTGDDVAAAPGWKSREDEAKIADHLRALGYLE